MKQALYVKIAEQLSQDIQRGHYALGEVLPSEPLLADKLKVSRATLRSALARLEQQGMVSRRKNVGTRVEALQARADYSTELSTVSDLIQWAQACKRVVQASHTVSLDAALAKQLRSPLGSTWLKVQSLRFDGDAALPVCMTDAYLDARYKAAIGAIRKSSSKLMSELIEAQFGLRFSSIEQEVSGALIDAEQARALGCKKGAAGLRVIRRYLVEGGQTVLITFSTHPADRYAIKTTITRT